MGTLKCRPLELNTQMLKVISSKNCTWVEVSTLGTQYLLGTIRGNWPTYRKQVSEGGGGVGNWIHRVDILAVSRNIQFWRQTLSLPFKEILFWGSSVPSGVSSESEQVHLLIVALLKPKACGNNQSCIALWVPLCWGW